MYQLTDKLIAHRWNRFDIVKEIEQIYISLKNIYKYFSEDIRMHVHISANKFLLRNLSFRMMILSDSKDIQGVHDELLYFEMIQNKIIHVYFLFLF